MPNYNSNPVMTIQNISAVHKLCDMRALELATRAVACYGTADAASAAMGIRRDVAIRATEMDVVFLARRLDLVETPTRAAADVKAVAEKIEAGGSWLVARLTSALEVARDDLKHLPPIEVGILEPALRMCEHDVKLHIHSIQTILAIDEMTA